MRLLARGVGLVVGGVGMGLVGLGGGVLGQELGGGGAGVGAVGRANVVIILADDMGFSDLGCYGGEIRTPNIDRLAGEGVRFAQFYNMARCCPSRASLMTGLYPHQAGVGFMNQDLGRPGYRGELNDRCVTMAEVLRGAGYHTGMVGKWHLSHLNVAREPEAKAKAMLDFESEEAVSPSKANWPCNRGFEEHWGTIPGVESYYDPYGLVHNEETIRPGGKGTVSGGDQAVIVSGGDGSGAGKGAGKTGDSSRAEVPRFARNDTPLRGRDGAGGKGFYYTDFITEHAVSMIDDWAPGAKEKPFFLYVAYTAPHWPMQAPEGEVGAYAETYKVGWDAIREARFARQVEMGLCKKEWGLSPRAFLKRLDDRDSVVGPWESAPAKEWQARRMAVYAAMVTHLDRGVGRVLEELKARGVADNTLVVFMSDNGACQENVQPGWYDVPSKTRDGREIHVGDTAKYSPGPEEVYQSYGPAWANASNTPFRRFKHFTEEGGISAPFIARWPAGGVSGGRLDHDSVGDIIDLMPTVVEVSGATYPKKSVRGLDVPAEEGKSLMPVLTGKGTMERGALFWEHEGNRAVRVGDWKLLGPRGEGWKLYNVVEDRTEMKDRSKAFPEKVEEMKGAYAGWARRCGVEKWPVR